MRVVGKCARPAAFLETRPFLVLAVLLSNACFSYKLAPQMSDGRHGEPLRIARKSFIQSFAASAMLGIAPALAATTPRQSVLQSMPIASDFSREALYWQVQAQNSMAAGDYKGAEGAWTQVLEAGGGASGTLATPWAARARCRASLDELEGSRADWDRAVALEPERADFRLARGEVLEALGAFAPAFHDYAYADYLAWQRDGRGSAEAADGAAAMLGKLGRWSEARDLWRAQARRDPERLLARGGEALAAYELGEEDEALRLLAALAGQHPGFADAWAALAALYWDRGERGRAEDAWARAQRGWAGAVARWPPRAARALDAFLTLNAPP
mmetsp:Transcript_19078/g.33171  ORF Transcript_19078/g.33171 Transcript_19078/m.33171 type:complete len:329 (-) Transcript_19078:773-1759(-)